MWEWGELGAPQGIEHGIEWLRGELGAPHVEGNYVEVLAQKPLETVVASLCSKMVSVHVNVSQEAHATLLQGSAKPALPASYSCESRGEALPSLPSETVALPVGWS